MMTLDCRLIKRQFDKPAVENYMVYGFEDSIVSSFLPNVRHNKIAHFPIPTYGNPEWENFPTLTLKGSDAVFNGTNMTVFKTIHTDSFSYPTAIVERRFIGNYQSNMARLFRITIRTENGVRKLIAPVSYPSYSICYPTTIIALTAFGLSKQLTEWTFEDKHFCQTVMNSRSLIFHYENQIESIMAKMSFAFQTCLSGNPLDVAQNEALMKMIVDTDMASISTMLEGDKTGRGYLLREYASPHHLLSSVSECGIFYDRTPCRPLYTTYDDDRTDDGYLWGELIDYIESLPVTDGRIILHNHQGNVVMEVVHEFCRWFEFSWNSHPDRLNTIGVSCMTQGVTLSIWGIFQKIFERNRSEINNVREIGIEWNYDDELRIDILDHNNNNTVLYFDLNRCALLTPTCSSDLSQFNILLQEYDLSSTELPLFDVA